MSRKQPNWRAFTPFFVVLLLCFALGVGALYFFEPATWQRQGWQITLMLALGMGYMLWLFLTYEVFESGVRAWVGQWLGVRLLLNRERFGYNDKRRAQPGLAYLWHAEPAGWRGFIAEMLQFVYYLLMTFAPLLGLIALAYWLFATR